MKGRPRDPKRSRTKTGHRRKPDEAPVVRALPAPVDLQADQVARPLAEPPEDLPEGAQAIWRALMPEIEARGLREGDYEMFRLLCITAHRARRATAQIEKYGELVKGQRGPMVNPMLRVERDATQMYIRLAEQFGLTFAARLRLGVLQLVGHSLASSLDADLERG
jgi:P27 family predicted phage terminase small subunit